MKVKVIPTQKGRFMEIILDDEASKNMFKEAIGWIGKGTDGKIRELETVLCEIKGFGTKEEEK